MTDKNYFHSQMIYQSLVEGSKLVIQKCIYLPIKFNYTIFRLDKNLHLK